MKQINQTLNKSLIEFQAKLGSEEKFNQKICTDLNDVEANMERYVENEKEFLDTIRDLLYLEFDYNNLDGGESKDSKTAKLEGIEKEMKIMHVEYPEFMNNWLRSNLSLKVARCSLSETNKILEHSKQFFE